MLIAGAVIVGRSPRAGRWLMYAGALLLSVFLLPGYVRLLPETIGHLSYDGLLPLLIDVEYMGSLILLPICDAMLVMDGYKGKER